MMTRTLLIAVAQLVLVAAFVLYSRWRVRKHRRLPSRHPAMRPVTARWTGGDEEWYRLICAAQDEENA